MPPLDERLVTSLQEALGLRRAVETGTYVGDGARRLAGWFPEVVTIELSEDLHRIASDKLADLPSVTVLQGHSVDRLPSLVNPEMSTFWFLDGHYSAGGIAVGEDDPCPVLDELAVIGGGHPDDVVVIDDLRMFAYAPGPPHDPSRWPSLVTIIDALRRQWPGHHVTVLGDQFIAVPARARAQVDRRGHELSDEMYARPMQRAKVLLKKALRRTDS